MDGDNAISVKAVLLGEPAVGKTCIISRFIHDTYEINGNSTTAATYVGKTMTFEEFNGKCIKFEIWDTAGQEKYRSLTKILYKDAKAAILVYDITRKSSFDEIKNYWYNQLKDFAPKNIIIAIAGNKCDLFDDENVSESEARSFANQIGAIFRLTSVVRNVGIEDLFMAIGNSILDPDFIDDNNINKRLKLDKKIAKKKKKKKFC